MRSPSLQNFDFSLFKNHNLLGEKLRVQFRAEFFNLLNRANLAAASVAAFDTQGRLIPVNAQIGPPTVTKSRQIQFGMKFVW